MRIYTNKNTKRHKPKEYPQQLYVFSPDSTNLVLRTLTQGKTDLTVTYSFNNTNKPTMAQINQTLTKNN